MSETTRDEIIRISHDDANSKHVDDLLKRQMSLRGDPGVTRDTGRHWYYQNWFVFMLVGTLGAIVAWALIEPWFDDMIYLQGKVGSLEVSPTAAEDVLALQNSSRALGTPVAILDLNGEKVFLFAGTKEIAGGKVTPLDVSILKGDAPVGIYVERQESAGQSMIIGNFIVRDPSDMPATPPLSLHEHERRQRIMGTLLFPIVAACIGLFLGAADGIVCRLPRRALIGGGIGLIVGFVGGFVFSILANVVYAPLNEMATKQSEGDSMTSLGFGMQMLGRTLGWGLAGLAMGLGQGIALRSPRIMSYGLVGGLVGGILGGLFFDPVDILLLGPDKPSAHIARLIGIGIIGASVGLMIGLVELLARDAWLRMTQGPLKGKEFLIFKDAMSVGSSPRSDLYLFNDPLVAEHHAVIRAVGDQCEIESRQSTTPILVNGRSLTRSRLRHGDRVGIGRTEFVFQQKKS